MRGSRNHTGVGVGWGGDKIVLSAKGGGCQMPIFVILLLQCELNQFEFLWKGGPYPTAHGLRYNIRLNYPTKGDHQSLKQKQVQRNK